jgi:ribosome biogenesis GTPase A
VPNIQQQAQASPLYAQLCQKVAHQYEGIKEEQFRAVVFGLPKTGKSVFSSLLMGE